MNFVYSDYTNDSRFSVCDFNCHSIKERLGPGKQYKIIWAKENDVTLEVDGYKKEVKRDHVLFCTPLHMLNVSPHSEGVISYIFNRRFYCIRDHDREVSCNGYLFYGSTTTLVKLSNSEKENFNLIFDFFQQEFKNQDHIQGEMLLVLLKRLLIICTRIARKNMPVPDLPNHKFAIIRNFNILVEEYYKCKHKLSEYAELMNLSSKSISNSFSKYYNKTPYKVISDRICLEAERMLVYSNKNVSQIAYELGFGDASHFSKFFKKHVGISPKEYKRNHDIIQAS